MEQLSPCPAHAVLPAQAEGHGQPTQVFCSWMEAPLFLFPRKISSCRRQVSAACAASGARLSVFMKIPI